ncbi:LamG-like jellyroll fold domain-containing protein [Melioribacteraceae bacterium 4301-Me]|uniref:LamG-like jellyroll fold domain-containing protein n=1 Tax=Pyranulibacter aquaticus TaxID=3163344 RepID=UPI00359A3449
MRDIIDYIQPNHLLRVLGLWLLIFLFSVPSKAQTCGVSLQTIGPEIDQINQVHRWRLVLTNQRTEVSEITIKIPSSKGGMYRVSSTNPNIVPTIRQEIEDPPYIWAEFRYQDTTTGGFRNFPAGQIELGILELAIVEAPGVNPDSIMATVFANSWNSGQPTTVCQFDIRLSGFPIPTDNDPCANLSSSLIISTGWNPTAGTTYPIGAYDNNWTVTSDPGIGYNVPRPAWVVDGSNWMFTPPGSPYQWIAPQPTATQPINGKYVFERCFCVKGDSGQVIQANINIQIAADDTAAVYLNGNLVGSTTGPLHFNHFTNIFKPVLLQPGKNCLRVDLHNTWGSLSGFVLSGTISTATGAPLYHTDLCCNPTAWIIGQKIWDKNCNGRVDQGEPGQQGWIITATVGNTTVSDTTDLNGWYYLQVPASLSTTCYTVSEIVQSGWSPSQPVAGSQQVCIKAGQTKVVNFLNCQQQFGNICVLKFNDLNGNGRKDTNEVVLSNWTIIVRDSSGNVIDTLITQDKPVCVSVPAPGTYTVSEVLQSGWTPTTPATDTVTVQPGQTVNVIFGNKQRETGCIQPPAGLVAWWPLDEQSGATTVADIIGGNTGTPVSGPVGSFNPPGPNSTAGMVGGAFYFYLDTTYVRVHDNPSLNFGSGDFTIDAWVNPVQVGSSWFQPIVDKAQAVTGGSGAVGYRLYIKNAQLHFALSDGSTIATVSTSPGSINYGTWQLVAAQRVGSALNLFINGALATTTTLPTFGSVSNTADLLLGGITAVGFQAQPIIGEIAIDEVELFNRALTQQEIQAIYNAGSAGKCKPQQLGSLCILKFDDLNGNGRKDTNEVVIPNWTIIVKDTLGNTIDTVITQNQPVCIQVSAPGTYIVSEVLQSGWTPTTQASQTVTVQPGQTVNVVFGNKQECFGCVPPPPKLVAWWPLDETSGTTANDLAGFNNQGTHVNGPIPTPGKVAGALHFDGIDDYVIVPNHSELNVGTTDFTIDTWVRTTDSLGVVLLLDKRSGPTPLGYSLFLSNGRLGVQMANGIGSAVCAPSPTVGVACVNYVAPVGVNVADGQWHLVAAVVNRADTMSGVRLYIDGLLVFTGAPLGTTPPAAFPPANLDNASDLYLGVRTPGMGGGGFFPGDLDEVEIIRYALTQAEIQAIYNAGSAGKCKPTTGIREIKQIPEKFELMQNYPNPFNPTTIIRFSVPKQEYVTLKVFDLLGREITTLVSEVLNPGTYEINFDARGLASGIYFYRLQAGNFIKTNKLILLR